MLKDFSLYQLSLDNLKDEKLLITTINAHSYNVACKDTFFSEVLKNSDVLIPDGISIVLAIKLLTGIKLNKIAGADLFFYEMNRMQQKHGKCFFLGSSETVLNKINEKINHEYPHVSLKTYSPPYKKEFSDEDNAKMIHEINAFQPDVLFVGMTAPKQEKWAYTNLHQLQANHICCIGAVFDFYAGTVNRAPSWVIKIGMEWFYRLIKEPRRMWKRYLIGNTKFIFHIVGELLK